MLKSLTCRNVDVDMQASLLFRSRQDSRDERPLVYPLRICRPCGNWAESDSEEDIARKAKRQKKNVISKCWQNCQLLTTLRTSEADQVPGMKLKVVEDLTESALPTHTEDKNSVRGGKRYEQVGEDAATKVLESLLESDKLSGDTRGFLILDLNVGVGDFFWAYLSRMKAMQCPVAYLGATPSSVEAEWLQHTMQEELTAKLLAGESPLPGFQARPNEPPAEMLMAAPPPPQLNVCNLHGGTLVVPEAIVKQWAEHPEFGSTFQDILKKIVDEFGEPRAQPEKPGIAAPGPSGPAPPTKREVAPAQTVAVSQLPQAKLAEAVVGNVKKDLSGKLAVRVGQDQAWWLINSSAGTVSLAAGTVIAGFGFGTFKNIPRAAGGSPGPVPDSEKLVLFDLKSSSDLVLFNSRLTSVGELIHSAQASRTAAELCYHEKKAVDEQSFNLHRKHEVYFKCTPKVPGQHEANGEDPANVEPKGTSGLAGLVPKVCLPERHCEVIWAVKWSAKGLMPIKPMVAAIHDIEILGQTAMKL